MKKDNTKKVQDYASKATAVRGAKRTHGDDWEKVVRVEQNAKTKRFELIPIPVITPEEATPEILRKSGIENPCLFVWNMADNMSANGARRKDTIAACVDAGVAFYTARTQYQLWYTANKANPA